MVFGLEFIAFANLEHSLEFLLYFLATLSILCLAILLASGLFQTIAVHFYFVNMLVLQVCTFWLN